MTIPLTKYQIKEFDEAWNRLSGEEQEYALCKRSPFHFATNYVETFHEKKRVWMRYPKYAYLRDNVFPEIGQEGNRYWLKSQRMLITISFCVWYIWAWLFKEDDQAFMGLWIGKHQNAVDDGGANSTWDSALGKMRKVYDSLPSWLLEIAMGRYIPSNRFFKFTTIHNFKNDNLIIGQAPTAGAGVGEGYTKAVVDEAANVQYLNTIHTNLSLSCPENRDYISFPMGRSNKFAEIHFTKGHYGFKKIEIDWRMNPEYDDEWYKRQCELMTSFEIAQRLDRSFEESAQGKVFDEFNFDKHVKDTPYLDEFMVYLFWDFGFVDATSIGFAQWDKINQTLRIFDWLEYNYTGYEVVAKEVKEKLFSEYGISTMRLVQSFGDPAAKAREQSSGKSLQDYYNDEGIWIETCEHHETIATLDRINDFLEKEKIQIDPKAEPIIETMRYWEWPKDAKGNPKTNQTQPAHTLHSHAGKALEYGFTMTCIDRGDNGLKDWTQHQEELSHLTEGIISEF